MIIESNTEFIKAFKRLIKDSSNIEMSTGYFSSSIFEIFYEEFNKFKNENGLIKIIIGADTSVEELNLLKRIENMSQTDACVEISEFYFGDLTNTSNEALKMLLILFRNKQIEIKVGFSENGGIYHSKYYIFENEETNTVINGSLNLTYSGLYRNYELVHLYDGKDDFGTYKRIFSNAWNNITPNARCESLSEIVINKISKELESRGCFAVDTTVDTIELRDYQEEAINNLLDNDMNGFLKMATGTGKTFTSIYSLKMWKENNCENLNVHIVVPYTHLVTQWQESIKEVFPEAFITECHTNKNQWKSQFNNTRYESKSKDCFSIFVNNSFFSNINSIRYSVTKNSILIVDEAHNLNLENIEDLDYLNYKRKIGLSATPEHYMFEERTSCLFNYFTGAYFEYGLEEAINNEYLTKYNYYPFLVNLNNDEIEVYKKLDFKLKNVNDKAEILNLLEERNLLLSSATGKIIKLKEILNDQELDRSLVYCNPGKVKGTDLSYIEYIASEIKSVRPNEHLEKITADESKEKRLDIVKRLESGSTDAILAIRCLDEGFDIPAIKDAYIMSSTKNPKEYVQRRGRVLRRYPGKKITNIYDFVVAIDGVILEVEQDRFEEYSSLAENQKEIDSFRIKNNWE
ncbi:DEAD/DEAH box helicase family protein [Mollicutes bacterium LVI A0078]|nr:DEAD/DEAH box helicase family protein [Mollicutes bacterium LVI A0075]WOO91444.1 DEAD/DEAH box helicase family protein [Mollicutes bacterium LVI A0078]